jgi:hypothetical protein
MVRDFKLLNHFPGGLIMDLAKIVPGQSYIPTRPRDEKERNAIPRWTRSMDCLEGLALKCFAISEKNGYVRLIVPDHLVKDQVQDSYWFKAEWLKPAL